MTTQVLSILNGSSSFLHIIRTTIKAWMSLNLPKIPFLTLELAARISYPSVLTYVLGAQKNHLIGTHF